MRKVLRLLSFPEPSNAPTVRAMTRFTPLTRSVTEWSTEFDVFQNFEHGLQHQLPSVEDEVEEEIHPYGDEDEDFAIRPLSK